VALVVVSSVVLCLPNYALYWPVSPWKPTTTTANHVRPLLACVATDDVTVETYYYDGQSKSPLLTRLTAGDVTVETYYYDCQSLAPSTGPPHSR